MSDKVEDFRTQLEQSGNEDLLNQYNALWPPKKPKRPKPEGDE